MVDIRGFEGIYGVTSCGRVWSYRSKKFLKPMIDKDGYLCISLRNKNIRKMAKIHRLVAEAYISNLENKPQVNHLDECKEHNYVNNLCWVTGYENANYGTRNQRLSEIQKKYAINRVKQVYCVELDKTYNSLLEAANELNLDSGSICKCCKGKLKKTKGYHFEYAEVV